MAVEFKLVWVARYEFCPAEFLPEDEWLCGNYEFVSEDAMITALRQECARGRVRNVEISRVITLTERYPNYTWQGNEPSPPPAKAKEGDPCPDCGAAMIQMLGGVECISDHK